MQVYVHKLTIISLFLSHTHTCVLTCESILNCLSLPPHILVKYIPVLYDINTVHILSSCKVTLFDFWIFSQTNLFGYIVKLLMLKLHVPTCVSNAILSTLHTLTNWVHLPCWLHSILLQFVFNYYMHRYYTFEAIFWYLKQ